MPTPREMKKGKKNTVDSNEQQQPPTTTPAAPGMRNKQNSDADDPVGHYIRQGRQTRQRVFTMMEDQGGLAAAGDAKTKERTQSPTPSATVCATADVAPAQRSEAQPDQQKSNTTNTTSSFRPRALSHLLGVRPPSLSREQLPSSPFVDAAMKNFSSVRDLVIEVRSTLRAVEEYRVQLAAEGRDFKREAKMNARRRSRQQNADGAAGGDDGCAQDDSAADRAASQIIEDHLSEGVFLQCVPQNEYAGDRRWDATVLALTRPSETVFAEAAKCSSEEGASSSSRSCVVFGEPIFVPIAKVSLLSRLTAGMAQSLLRAALRRFAALAPSHNRSNSGNGAAAEVGFGDKLGLDQHENDDDGGGDAGPREQNQPQQRPSGEESLLFTPWATFSISRQQGGDQQQQHQQLGALLDFLAHLRHGALGQWMFAALASVELPIHTEVSTQLQETLRIATETLTLIFTLRPDLVGKWEEERCRSSSNNNVQALDGDERAHSCEYCIRRVNHAEEEPGKPNFHVALKQQLDPSCICGGDVKTLMTIITIVGKYFRQANKSLLPL